MRINRRSPESLSSCTHTHTHTQTDAQTRECACLLHGAASVHTSLLVVVLVDAHAGDLVGEFVDRPPGGRRQVETVGEDVVGDALGKVGLDDLPEAVILVTEGVVVPAERLDKELGPDAALLVLLG